jgi:phenylacetate-coenzyme A ligase PaaK-like adenylate-forming protein
MNKRQIRPLARLHGYWMYRRFLRHTPSWGRDRRRAFIFEHLKNTLVRANENVPFYQKRFRDAGFNPATDFKSPADLARIPLLTKDDVRRNFRELIDSRYCWDAVEAGTSGTTGEPMKMMLNERYIAFDYATMFRHWGQARYTFRDRFMALRSYVPKNETDQLWHFNWPQNTLYMSAYHLSPANAGRYVDAVLKFRPQFIRGYASSLHVFAEYAYPRRDQFNFVKGIFTASETLLPSERENIERTFGKMLYDWYGMTEPVAIIHETNAHDGMHVQWDYGYTEFLPSPELPENEFRLVATGFHNPVMPFIRYDTGDVVRLQPGASATPYDADPPVIESVIGRKDECIVTPDGRRLPSLNFYTVFSNMTDVLKWQLVQCGEAEVVANIALRDVAPNREVLLADIRRELTARFGPECPLQVDVTNKFITNPDGKTPTIVRRSNSTAQAAAASCDLTR